MIKHIMKGRSDQMITEDELIKLKSGTDIRGTASNTANKQIELTDEAIKKICISYIRFLMKKLNKKSLKITVGSDVRISSPRIKKSVLEACTNSDTTVYDIGVASTPAVFMTIVTDIKSDGGIEITASHLPYQKNGLKFFTKDGGLEANEITDILKSAVNCKLFKTYKKSSVIQYDYMDTYAEFLKNLIITETGNKAPLQGLKIAVDAGNGVGGFFAKDVLKPLGADISGSVFLNPDGKFPNHIPNPENSDAISAARKSVIESKSDFGFIFDTDVDRVGCISQNGMEINKNRLIALSSIIALQNSSDGTIVTDSLTSDGLREFIEKKLHAKQLRYKRGYKNVIDKAKELNQNGEFAPLAIETSGHAALKENYFQDDGAYLAAKITALLANVKSDGGSIEELIADLKEPLYSTEIRIKINNENFKQYGLNILYELKEYALEISSWKIEENNYEGVRINFRSGWFLLRLSLHEPILPLNIEADDKNNFDLALQQLFIFLNNYNDISIPTIQ